MGLTDTSRGADSLVCLVAISDKVISQKLNMVLLPWVYIDKKEPKCVNKSQKCKKHYKISLCVVLDLGFSKHPLRFILTSTLH